MAQKDAIDESLVNRKILFLVTLHLKGINIGRMKATKLLIGILKAEDEVVGMNTKNIKMVKSTLNLKVQLYLTKKAGEGMDLMDQTTKLTSPEVIKIGVKVAVNPL